MCFVDGESSASASYTNPLVTPLAFSTRSDLGFRNFFAGVSDIASSFRPIRESDYTNSGCPASSFLNAPCNGRLPVGVVIGRQPMALIANFDAIANSSLVFGSPPNILTAGLLFVLFDGICNNNPLVFISDCEGRDYAEFFVSWRGHVLSVQL